MTGPRAPILLRPRYRLEGGTVQGLDNAGAAGISLKGKAQPGKPPDNDLGQLFRLKSAPGNDWVLSLGDSTRKRSIAPQHGRENLPHPLAIMVCRRIK